MNDTADSILASMKRLIDEAKATPQPKTVVCGSDVMALLATLQPVESRRTLVDFLKGGIPVYEDRALSPNDAFLEYTVNGETHWVRIGGKPTAAREEG